MDLELSLNALELGILTEENKNGLIKVINKIVAFDISEFEALDFNELVALKKKERQKEFDIYKRNL